MIVREIAWRDPVAAFFPLRGEPFAQLLHAGARAGGPQWSIITAFPTEILETNAHGNANPFAQLRARSGPRKQTANSATASFPFVSGAMGFIGYEAARYLDASMAVNPSPLPLPDVSLGFYDGAAVFSRDEKRAWIVGLTARAVDQLEEVLGREPRGEFSKAGDSDIELTSDMERSVYEEKISQVINDILDGKYYQTNIAHQLTAKIHETIDGFQIFENLIANSDALYAAYLSRPDAAVISNSPERFFSVDYVNKERRIITEPIKGTRPRGQNKQDDERLLAELLSDEKDRAENIMIADLMRNDLSQICVDGSISEDAICEPLSLRYVHHLVSRISGTLAPDMDIIDIFRALFPCGSITGAPKISAMSAIAKYERNGRGPYCGAIGYIDDRGGMSFSVGIRTMIADLVQQMVIAPVGGGITLRSSPESEYQETLSKARGALNAIGVTVGDLI